jgi:putative ABC transport system substrate-binding protein
MKRREFLALVAGAVARPREALTQQPTKVYRIAVFILSLPVSQMTETSDLPWWRALFQDLHLLGYVEGQNLVVERYSGEGRVQDYARLAHDVVQRKPDLIFAVSSRMVGHLKAATTTIAIVGVFADPVSFELVAGLAKPGGNITGIDVDVGSGIEIKRLEMLRVAIPSLTKVGFLASRYAWDGPRGIALLRETAQQLGISLVGPPLEGTIQETEYRRVFAAMTEEGADAIIVGDQPENVTYMRLISELSEKSRLPASCPRRQYLEGGVLGCLMSYGVSLVDEFRREPRKQLAAVYVTVLRGLPKIARAHVLDHALTQRGNPVTRSHGEYSPV